MIEASCHCGAIRFEVETAPDEVTDCNCSICRRSGALWAYYQAPQVRFAAENGPTDIYMWRYRMLEFHRCRACGCLTHWAAVGHLRDRVASYKKPSAIVVVETLPRNAAGKVLKRQLREAHRARFATPELSTGG